MTGYGATFSFSNTPQHTPSIDGKILECGMEELSKGGKHTEAGP